MIFSGLPVPRILSAIMAVGAAFWCIRQSSGVPRRQEPKVSGFRMLLVVVAVPNILVTAEMARSVSESIYAISFGATSHDLVWIALQLLVRFPLFALGAVGLTYLAGTFLEHVLRRRVGSATGDGGDRTSPS